MLSFDGRATELAGLVPGEEDNPPSSLSVSFEHIFLVSQMPETTAHPILNDAPKSNNLEIYAVWRKMPASSSQVLSHKAAIRSLCVTMTEVSPFSRCNSRKTSNMRSPVR